jgi:diadenylate cyclase
MRHRAALGITEATDAVALVVSEEHRDVRVAIGSQLHVAPSRSELLRLVHEALEVAAPKT